MKTITRTKLLIDEDKKYVEVREYELGQDLKIIYENEYMILTKVQQKKGKVVNTQQSKFYPYKYYRMYKFLWKPKEVKNYNQVTYIGNSAYLK